MTSPGARMPDARSGTFALVDLCLGTESSVGASHLKMTITDRSPYLTVAALLTVALVAGCSSTSPQHVATTVTSTGLLRVWLTLLVAGSRPRARWWSGSHIRWV
jgi:hypothetical protein